MLLDLDPGGEAELILLDLDSVLLALGVLAAGALVGGGL